MQKRLKGLRVGWVGVGERGRSNRINVSERRVLAIQFGNIFLFLTIAECELIHQ